MISERDEKLKMMNVSLEDRIKELEKINNQVQEKEKVCSQEKENLSLEISALRNKLCSASAELKSCVSENNEMTGILESSKGRFSQQGKK